MRKDNGWEKFDYKPVKERTDEELSDYKKWLEQILEIEEAFLLPWRGFHSYELGQVEKEMKCRNVERIAKHKGDLNCYEKIN